MTSIRLSENEKLEPMTSVMGRGIDGDYRDSGDGDCGGGGVRDDDTSHVGGHSGHGRHGVSRYQDDPGDCGGREFIGADWGGRGGSRWGSKQGHGENPPQWPSWICCFFHPPPPAPTYIRPPPVYIVNGNPVLIKSPALSRELTVLEFRAGDVQTKYVLTLPIEANPGSVVHVKLGEREFTILLPDYLIRGEKVIIIAPATSSAQYLKASNTGNTAVQASVEIRTIELRDSDTPSKYLYTIPENAIIGQLNSVTLDGKTFTIKLPDSVKRGDPVIIIVPASIL